MLINVKKLLNYIIKRQGYRFCPIEEQSYEDTL